MFYIYVFQSERVWFFCSEWIYIWYIFELCFKIPSWKSYDYNLVSFKNKCDQQTIWQNISIDFILPEFVSNLSEITSKSSMVKLKGWVYVSCFNLIRPIIYGHSHSSHISATSPAPVADVDNFIQLKFTWNGSERKIENQMLSFFSFIDCAFYSFSHANHAH